MFACGRSHPGFGVWQVPTWLGLWSQATKSGSHPFLLIWTYPWLPAFIFSFFDLDLPSTASSFKFSFFIWTYPHLPAFIFSFFDLDLPLSANSFHLLDSITLILFLLESLALILFRSNLYIFSCCPQFHFHFFYCLNPVGFFFSFLFLIFSKMQMQMLCLNYVDEMPWSVLPMWYANILP